MYICIIYDVSIQYHVKEEEEEDVYIWMDWIQLDNIIIIMNIGNKWIWIGRLDGLDGYRGV